jgi:hypothetical protein
MSVRISIPERDGAAIQEAGCYRGGEASASSMAIKPSKPILA